MGRVAAFIGLNIIGALIGVGGLSSVFAGFAIVAAFGSVIAALFITETIPNAGGNLTVIYPCSLPTGLRLGRMLIG